ncbi:MAG: redoxin domain-containing protein [Lentisphaeria bacterium]|nr:redoxin domain-containing protein [Lentisphaeria bacterium]
MRVKILFFLLLFPLVPLFALRSGDKISELQGVRWLSGNPVRLYIPEGGQELQYRVVVFVLTHAPGTQETFRMLEDLQKKYSKTVRIAVVSPDPESDVKDLLSRMRKPAFSVAVDRDRKLVQKYMAGSMLYPMAFVASPGGVIAWNGEAADLPELLAEAEKKPVDVEKQKKLSVLLDELQVMMRDNTSRKMRHHVRGIFRLDPGNAAALRMTLFSLEHSGRIPEAWLILREQLGAAPGKARIYLTAMDLIARYPVLAGELPGVVSRFVQNIRDLESCDAAVLTLLTRFSFSADALLGAVKIYEAASSLTDNAPAAQLAGHAAAGALLASRLGNWNKAVELQTRSRRLWLDAGNAFSAAAAEKLLQYYQLCLKTKVKW